MESNSTTNLTTQDLLQELSRLSGGLLYMSETDAPFEPVHFAAPLNEAPESAVSTWAGQPENAPVEVVELDWFFRHAVKEPEGAGEEEKKQAHRFQELNAFLKQHLQEPKVYRVGERKIDALLLGKTPSGEYAGLKTTLVET